MTGFFAYFSHSAQVTRNAHETLNPAKRRVFAFSFLEKLPNAPHVILISSGASIVMSEKFKEGNVVRLKSGGPEMTVFFAGPVDFGHSVRNDLVSCKWFVTKAKPLTDRFQDLELELVKE